MSNHKSRVEQRSYHKFQIDIHHNDGSGTKTILQEKLVFFFFWGGEEKWQLLLGGPRPPSLAKGKKTRAHTGLKTGKHSILHRIRTTLKPYKMWFYLNM
jgi:hypothetical protein